jgi:hypothetical protein
MPTAAPNSAPIGLAQQRAIDRVAGRPEIDHQTHQWRDHHTLPVQPLPAEMVDIETDQRARRIKGEADADRVERNRRQPPADRQIAEHDHQRRRHEGAEQQAMHDAQRNQGRIVVHEGNDQRDERVDEAGNAQHTSQAEHGRKPRHRGRDEDLRADASGGEPGAFVEGEPERTA